MLTAINKLHAYTEISYIYALPWTGGGIGGAIIALGCNRTGSPKQP